MHKCLCGHALISLGYAQQPGYWVILIPSEELLDCFSKWLQWFYIPASICLRVYFFTYSPTLVIWHFGYSLTSECELISYYSFDLHFPWKERRWRLRDR